MNNISIINGKVVLSLNNKYPKYLGIINGDTLKTFRNLNHVYRKYNSIGFNYKLLNDYDNIKYINLIFDGKSYIINKEDILKSNLFSHHDKKNFEYQIHYPLNKFLKK